MVSVKYTLTDDRTRPVPEITGMSTDYHDRWISCTSDGITIRGYYFPWGTKRIPYSALRAVQKVDLGTFRGRGRMWGTGNPRYWASLDPRRPGKRAGFLLDVGRGVTPLITPDDPAAVEDCIRAHRPEVVASGTVPAPVI
jgi:hypothetical protein